MIDALLAQWLYLWPLYLVFLAPFTYWASEPLTTAFTQLLAAAIFVLVGFSCFYHAGTKTSRWFYHFCLAWLAGLALSSFCSVDPSTSAPVFWKILGLVLTAAGMRYALCEETTQAFLFYAAGYAALIHGFVGVFEFMDPTPMPLTWVDPGMRELIKGRSSGLFGDPNLFGTYVGALLPLVLAGFFSLPPTPWNMALWCFSFLAGGCAVFMSFSRGAYLSTALGLLVVVLLRKPSWKLTPKRKAVLAVCLFLGLVFFVGPFKYRLFSIAQTADMTISQRSFIARAVLNHLGEIPLFGFGLHTFNQVYPRFRQVGGDYPAYAHNEFLQSLLETGPLTTLCLFGLVLILGSAVVRLMRKDVAKVSWLTAGCSGTLACLLLQNLSGFSARIFPISLVLAVAIGGVLRTMRREDLAPPLMISRGLGRIVGGAFLGIFLLFTLKNLHVQILLTDAVRALSEKEFMVAESDLQGILRIDRQVPAAHFYLSRVFQAYGKWSLAEHHLETALKLNPSEALYWQELSRLSRKASRGNALEAMARATSLDPGSEYFRLEYAQMLATAGRTLDAIRELDQVLTFSPGWHEVYTGFKQVELYRQSLQASLPRPGPVSVGVREGTSGAIPISLPEVASVSENLSPDVIRASAPAILLPGSNSHASPSIMEGQ